MSAEGSGARFESRPPDWLGFDEACARILSEVRTLDPERVPLSESLGRAMVESLAATATLPPWDNSAVDGYAVRAGDVARASPASPVVLSVVGRLKAGDAPGASVDTGQAVRIMTGSPLPPGADAVVKVEDTDGEATEGLVAIRASLEAKRHVRPAGQDMRVGDPLLEVGDPIRPGTIAVLAALGCSDVLVRRRPVTAIVTTGDELRTPDRYDEVRAGTGVPESNGPMVAAQVAHSGATPRYLGVSPDEPEALRTLLRAGAETDALVTIGGASMGEADLVKKVLTDLGFELVFWRVRMRPGSPFGFGWLPRGETKIPVFSLPGNPASAFATFELFVRPWLLAAVGHRRVHRRRIRCVAGEDLRGPPGLTEFLRVRVDSRCDPPMVTLCGPQGSGLVRSLSRAEGLAVVPEEADGVARGEGLEVLLLDDAPALLEAPSWP